MKKLLCSLVLLAAISLPAPAQSASAILKKFKALPEAEERALKRYFREAEVPARW